MKKFWNFIWDADGERVLRLEGPIDEDNFWGDSVTPDAFRDELEAEEGDVTVWINSPGGSVFAAAEIYTMLKDHKGKVTVKIDAIAASAASVIAMAGDTVLMSPVAMLMLHDPMTIAMGNAADMEKAIATLNEVKESIINAYVAKSGMSRKKVAQLMSDETWMNAKKAVELGFADAILFADGKQEEDDEKEVKAVWQPYSMRVMGQAILNRIVSEIRSDGSAGNDTGADEEPDETACDKAAVEPSEAGVDDSNAADTGEPDLTNESAEDEVAPDADTGMDLTETGAEDEVEPVADTDMGLSETANNGGEETPPADTQPPADTEPEKPVIGMDGRTRDGAMPYEILKDRLEWMR